MTPAAFTAQQEADMTKADSIHAGKVYYFGHRNVPHVVTSVVPVERNVQFVAKVCLKGPRGGESVAYVRADGTCRKI